MGTPLFGFNDPGKAIIAQTTDKINAYNADNAPSLSGKIFGGLEKLSNSINDFAYTGKQGTADPSGAAAQANAAAGSSSDVAAYTDQLTQLEQLLKGADVSQQNGQRGIETSYTNNAARLQDNQNKTMRNYDIQRGDTDTNFQKALGTIDNNARNGFNSLQLLLGGTGSAGNVLAPFAVSQAANKQRGASTDAYARNNRDLDLAVGDAQGQFESAQSDLLGQKNNKLQELIGAINTQKQQYLSQKSAAQNQLRVAQGGSYATPTANNNEIARLIAEQQGLSSKYAEPAYSVKTVNARAPELAAYTSQAAQLAGGNNQPDEGVDDTSAALQALLQQNKDKTNGYSY